MESESKESQSSSSIVVQAYSSDLPAAERKNILEKFKAQEIQMFVFFFIRRWRLILTLLFFVSPQISMFRLNFSRN